MSRTRRVALRLALASACVVGAGSCGGDVHQIAVVIDTALCEPGDGDTPDFDSVRVTVEGVDDPFCAVFDDPAGSGCVQIASRDFPLVLPLQSASGTGSPQVQVELLQGSDRVGCATGRPTFDPDNDVVVRIDVERPCDPTACVEAMTVLDAGTDPNAVEARECEPPSPSPTTPIQRIAAGAQHACLVDARGELYCWGNNDDGQLGVMAGAPRALPTRIEFSGGGFVEDVDGGQGHTCAVLNQGGSHSIKCWGLGSDGQLGNGMAVSSPNPLDVMNSAGARGLSLGPFHSCAYFAPDGTVSCWGRNLQGEVNGVPGDAERVPAAVAVPNGTGGTPDVVELAAGGSSADEVRHTCARTSHGVYCWGSDDSGQLGRTSDGPEVALAEGLGTITQIAAGARSTCAVDDAGQIFCWGRNNVPGTLGIATGARADVLMPTQIDTTTSVLAEPDAMMAGPTLSTTAAGDSFRCFIDTAARVQCLGTNTRDRLGSAGIDTPTPRAVELPGAERFQQIVTGTNFACALPEGGGLPYCWGDNTVGQLGRGTTGGTGAPEQLPDCGG